MKIASSSLASIAFCSLLSLLPIRHVAAFTTTEWQGPTGAVGDWFEPANWTSGVPAVTPFPSIPPNATIDNDGIARINGGQARAISTHIGLSRSGELIVDGGALETIYAIHLGSEKQSVGRLALNGGRVDSQSMFVGSHLGTGRVDQLGGALNAGYFTLGASNLLYSFEETSPPLTPDDFGHGEYNFSGGRASFGNAQIGSSGVGHFRQSGGVAEVEFRLTVGGEYAEYVNPWSMPYPYNLTGGLFPAQASLVPDVVTNGFLIPPTPSRGRYELSGGSLETSELFVNNTGEIRQTGGSLQADYLELVGEASYEFAAGSLRVESGLHANDGFDFAHSNVTLSAGSAIVNFAHSPKNAENAKINVGPNSLTIFPAQYDVAAHVGQFATQGLVHFVGDDLSIPVNRTVEGRGTIFDHAIVGGKLLASAQEFAAINLNGLELKAGGEVDLGRGVLQVPDDRTVIRNGSLKAEQIHVSGTILNVPVNVVTTGGIPPLIPTYPDITPGLARQTAGSVEVDQLSISNGRYEISGGTLTADRIELGYGCRSFPRYAFSAEPRYSMTQRGGTVTVESLDLNPVYIYPMTTLRSLLHHSLQDLNLVVTGPNLGGKALYEIHSGNLHAERISVNSGYYTQGAELVQTGGTVIASQDLLVYGEEGRYSISGGALSARRLQIGATSPMDGRSGTFAILNDNALVYVAGELNLGGGAQLVAVPGSTIRFTRPEPVDHFEYPAITGNSLDIHSTDPEALAGLENLKLIFEGGADLTSTIEVAGADLGPSLAGFYKNFALDTLVIGGAEEATVSLVDLVDNSPSTASQPEALYVDRLVVYSGSTLDLNGLKIYYRTALIAENGSAAFSGFAIQIVPEPTAMCLALLLAMPIYVRRRR